MQVSPLTKRTRVTPGTESKAEKYGSLIGSGVGLVVGAIGGKSPQAAMGGAAAGSSLGGLVGGAMGKSEPAKTEESFSIGQLEKQDNAMARKLAASREDRLAVLRQAEAALPQLPPELRQEYAGTIVRATMEEEKRRAMGMGG